jgi:uncharacterized protein (DUF983 family)
MNRVLSRCLRWRCPNCGAASLFRGWFAVHPECPACRLPILREPGYFLGSIYFNYGFTALVVTAGVFLLTDRFELSPAVELAIWVPVAMLLPLLTFRHARALWLAMDFLVDPWEPPPTADRQDSAAANDHPV